MDEGKNDFSTSEIKITKGSGLDKKKVCKYEGCNREAWRDYEYCIFHSKDVFAKEGETEWEIQKFLNEHIEWLESKGEKGERANFTGFNLYRTALEDADLRGADLSDASLHRVYLNGANLSGAFLWKSNLCGTSFNGADLSEADLSGANLNGCYLCTANLKRANLFDANLTGADLYKADLKEANLKNANIENANLRRTDFEDAEIDDIKYNRSGKYKGIRISNARGNPKFIRFARDQEYLEVLRETKKGRIIYFFWNLFADCGRSILRWALWSILFAIFFAFIYHNCFYLEDINYFKNSLDSIHDIWSGLSFLYYSIVTFTTLGFGDITPAPGWLQFWVTIEVILGYIMLGGLISIFANKFARRS